MTVRQAPSHPKENRLPDRYRSERRLIFIARCQPLGLVRILLRQLHDLVPAGSAILEIKHAEHQQQHDQNGAMYWNDFNPP